MIELKKVDEEAFAREVRHQAERVDYFVSGKVVEVSFPTWYAHVLSLCGFCAVDEV